MRGSRWLLPLFAAAGFSCWGQTPITLPTSCGAFGSTGSAQTRTFTVNPGQAVSYPLSFTVPGQATSIGQIIWRLTDPSGNFRLSSTTTATTTLSGQATVAVMLSVTVSYLIGGEISCNGSLSVTLTVTKPSIQIVSPLLFTACAPRDVPVVISGSGFQPTVAKVYFGNSPSNYEEVPATPGLQGSDTRLDRLLRTGLTSKYPSSANNQTFFVVSNDPTLQVTSEPFYVTVRQTPRIDSLSPQAVTGTFRTIAVTGANFTADTILILVSSRDNRLYTPPVQGLNANGTGFTIPLDENTYQTQGPFTGRVVNRENGNPFNPNDPTPSYYSESCSPSRQLNSPSPAIGAPTGVTLSVSSATACGPLFNLDVTAAGIVTTLGQPRLQLNGTVSSVSYTNNRFTVPISTSQLGSAAGSLAFSVANQVATNQFSAAATSNLTILAPPTITGIPAVSATGTNQSITLGVSNLAPTTRIVMQRTGQADTVLTEVSRTTDSVTVTVPGTATGTASTNAVRLIAVNADGANSNALVVTAPPAGCPTPTNLMVQPPGTGAISQLIPNSEFAGRTTDLTVRVLGSNFRTGATVQFNQETPLTGTLVNGGELQVTLPVARFSTTGTIQVRVQNTGGEAVTGTLPFTITAPRTPTFTLAATPATTTSPAVQPTLALTQSNFSERPLTAVFTLEFQPDGATGVTTWPANVAPLFPNNSRTVTVTIPTTGGTVTLPNNGQFSLPFAAGVVTARLTALTVQGTQVSVLPATAVTATTTLSPAAPAVETTVAPLFNRPTPTGNYQVDLNTISNTLNLTSILLRFDVAAGTRVDGSTSFTFDRNNSADLFNRIAQFCRDNLTTGGQFRLVFPLTISSGDATSISAVTVQFTNSAGQSSETRIARQ